MELDCQDNTKFLEGIYGFLRKAGICFLNGAFVTDDPDGGLFTALYSGRSIAACKNIRIDRPLGTHMNFMYDEKHEEERRRNRFMAERHTIIDPVLPPVQYEKVINPRATHLCDPGGVDPKTEEAKGVIMFYPFTIDNGQKFLYFKLEGYPAKHIKHAIQAIKRYGLGIKKKDPYPKRRQDEEESNNYQRDIEAIIDVLDKEGVEPRVIDLIRSKINYYNTKIRTADEMYLPVELFAYIFGFERRRSPSKFRSAVMTVMAAAHASLANPPVGSLSWAYNMKVSPFSNVEDCLAAQYSDEDELKDWSKDHLYWLAKGMGLQVNRKMTKPALCHEIVNPLPNRRGLRPLSTMALDHMTSSNPRLQIREGKPYLMLQNDQSMEESSTDTTLRYRPAMRKPRASMVPLAQGQGADESSPSHSALRYRPAIRRFSEAPSYQGGLTRRGLPRPSVAATTLG